MRFRERKGLHILLFVSAFLAAIIVLWLRAESYRVAAEKYDEYARAYGHIPDGTPYLDYSTCYGRDWDSFTRKVRADVESRGGNKAYRLNRFELYKQLSKKYEQAASRPWTPLASGPPRSP